MGRTNVVIDDELVEKAMEITGAKSRREVIDMALRKIVRKHSLANAFKKLRGRIEWDGDLDSWRKKR